jgi:hypothetical protein
MADVLVVLATLGFFAGCAAYVALCERIIRAETAESTGERG